MGGWLWSVRPLPPDMGRERGYRATGDARSEAVGPAREDDRHERSKNESGAVGVRQEAQLLRDHVARLEIGREQDVSIARHLRRDPLHLRRVATDGVVEGQRPIE